MYLSRSSARMTVSMCSTARLSSVLGRWIQSDVDRMEVRIRNQEGGLRSDLVLAQRTFIGQINATPTYSPNIHTIALMCSWTTYDWPIRQVPACTCIDLHICILTCILTSCIPMDIDRELDGRLDAYARSKSNTYTSSYWSVSMDLDSDFYLHKTSTVPLALAWFGSQNHHREQVLMMSFPYDPYRYDTIRYDGIRGWYYRIYLSIYLSMYIHAYILS